jgi:hypothetical protein
MGTRNGKLVPIVQEYVLNTYTRFDGYNVKAADEYWAATKDYWAAVRAQWAQVADTKGGISIQEVAETGTVIGERMMGIADDIQAGKLTTAKGIDEAKRLIDTNTKRL